MLRLTSSVFRDLAILMAGFGVLIGIVFPAFALLLGVSVSVALSPHYVVACIAAGLLVGGVNWALARLVVGRRLALLADRMGIVADNVRAAMFTGDWLDCQAERCRVVVDSTDEIGRSSRSFNELVDALAESHAVEAATGRFTDLLASELDVDRLASGALGQLLAIGEAQAGAVIAIADGDLSLRASVGLREPGALLASDRIGRVVRERVAVILDLPDDILVDGIVAGFRPRQVLLLPLVFKSVVLGVVILAAGHEFRSEGRRLVEMLRPTLGLALNNAMAHERLQRLAALDPLTDAYNRRFGLGRLREELSRTVRSRVPLAVVMLDVDHFKRVNDTFGHVAGDRVLRAVTAATRSVLREGDVLVRYGGDELLVVLPGALPDDAAELADRLRRAIEQTVVAEGDRAIRVTVSVGVATCSGAGRLSSLPKSPNNGQLRSFV